MGRFVLIKQTIYDLNMHPELKLNHAGRLVEIVTLPKGTEVEKDLGIIEEATNDITALFNKLVDLKVKRVKDEIYIELEKRGIYL